jgi:DNA-binding CsgD family transcriptional regulator
VLQTLRLGPVIVDRSRYLPPVIRPLVQAAERGDDIVAPLLAIVRRFGFDDFTYATANYHLRPDNDERMYVFTTLPKDWVVRYDQSAYVECDPRISFVFDNALPLVWDQASERGRGVRTDEFLDNAARFNLRSGVAFSVYSVYPSRNMVALNSARPVLDRVRREEIANNLGEIVLFGQYFNDLFVKGVIEKGYAPATEGIPLSPRERQCLELAARGMSSIEIGGKLGVAPRTVDFHFSNMISKLGVHNRQEAIARAARQGLLAGRE